MNFTSIFDLGTDVRAMAVALVDASGVQITSLTSTPPALTATVSAVAATSTDFVVLAANASRKQFSIFNRSGKKLYVNLGAVATATLFAFVLADGDYYESKVGAHVGAIHGILASGSGSINVAEYV